MRYTLQRLSKSNALFRSLFFICVSLVAILSVGLLLIHTTYAAGQTSSGGNGSCAITPTSTGDKLTCNGTVIGPNSPLDGKYIDAVSVGNNHSCALASARVYCWGNNSHGQLGNKSGSNSSVPVMVDVSSSSALYKKEVIDVSAAKDFTCALASDGTVACWGEGDNGRLGLGSSDIAYTSSSNSVKLALAANPSATIRLAQTAGSGRGTSSSSSSSTTTCGANSSSTGAGSGRDVFECGGPLNLNPTPTVKSTTHTPNVTYKDFNYPQAVYTGGALQNYKGVRLSSSAGAVMCVIAIPKSSVASSSANGSPFCWGSGVGDNQTPGNSTTACSIKNNSSWNTLAGQSVSTGSASAYHDIWYVYFDASAPINSSGSTSTFNSISVAASDNITGIGGDNRTYRWGLHGYREDEATGQPTCTYKTYHSEMVCGNGKTPTQNPNNGKWGCGGGNVNASSGKPCSGGGHGEPGCGGGTPSTIWVPTTYYAYSVNDSFSEMGSAVAQGPY